MRPPFAPTHQSHAASDHGVKLLRRRLLHALPLLPWWRVPPLALLGTAFGAHAVELTKAAHPPAAAVAVAARPVLLANLLRPDIDVRAYLVSEKFDGVRATWDGKHLRFRSGRPVAAPAWWLARLPATALDGELWLDRGHFDELSGMVRKTMPVDDDWRRIQYLIFELPDAPGSFAERHAQMVRLIAASQWPALQAVAQSAVADRADLQRRLDEVLRRGGEGLMLHRADAAVTTGRSDVLLKLKRLLDDEAVVLAHLPGKGRLAGQLGALEVRTASGIVFRLGSGLSDAVRKSPPPPGTVVTFSYRDLTPTGKPRFASFLRVRDDS